MSSEQRRPDLDAPSPELVALNAVVTALKSLRDDARQRVINAALMLLGAAPLSTPPVQQTSEQGAGESAASQPAAESLTGSAERPPITDIRSLKDEKKPRTAVEMATLTAYYLSEVAPKEERKATIESEDIRNYFRLAQFRLPSQPPHQTLKYAKYAGYLDAAGRGSYKLNPVGYNLVVHGLPSKESSGPPTIRRKKPSNNTPKKQGTKKQPRKSSKR
jgi:hypothetical protein